MTRKAAAKPYTKKVVEVALGKAIAAVKEVCRETERGPIISDLSPFEIERRIVAAITNALKY